MNHHVLTIHQLSEERTAEGIVYTAHISGTDAVKQQDFEGIVKKVDGFYRSELFNSRNVNKVSGTCANLIKTKLDQEIKSCYFS